MLTILPLIDYYFYQSGPHRVEPLAERRRHRASIASQPSCPFSARDTPALPACRERDNSDILLAGVLRRGRLMAPPYARAALLDRDGTVIADRGYLADPAGVEILPGAAEGLARMRSFGLGLAILTNQSGIGRGYFDEAQLRAVHLRMEQLLQAQGVRLDGIYYCPCHPDRRCGCRKPGPGLVHAARTELGFDPSQSFVIGDKGSDIGMGRSVSAKTFLVRSGATADAADAEGEAPDYVVEDLVDAAMRIEDILREEQSP